MIVYAFIDEAHAHSVFEDNLPDDDQGIPMYRSLDQAKEAAQRWVNDRLAVEGKPLMAIEWQDAEECSAPGNDCPEHFQILRVTATDPEATERYLRQNGR